MEYKLITPPTYLPSFSIHGTVNYLNTFTCSFLLHNLGLDNQLSHYDKIPHVSRPKLVCIP